MESDCERLRNEVKALMDDVANLAEELRLAREDAVSIMSSEDLLFACLKANSPGLLDEVSEVQLDLQSDELKDLELPEDVGNLGCQQLARELPRLSSIKSALAFELSDLQQRLRTESVRLAGLVALCRHFEPDIAESIYSRVLDQMLRKYVGV